MRRLIAIIVGVSLFQVGCIQNQARQTNRWATGRSEIAGPDDPEVLYTIHAGLTLNDAELDQDSIVSVGFEDLSERLGYQPTDVFPLPDGRLVLGMWSAETLENRYDIYNNGELERSINHPQPEQVRERYLVVGEHPLVIYEEHPAETDPGSGDVPAFERSRLRAVGLDGEELWNLDNSGYYLALENSLYDSGVLYSIKLNHDEQGQAIYYLFAVDATGDELFATALPAVNADFTDLQMYISPPVIAGADLLVCVSESCVVGVSLAGDVLWTASGGYEFGRTPVVSPAGEVAIVATHRASGKDGQVMLRIGHQGEITEFFTPDSGACTPPSFAPDGSMYFIRSWVHNRKNGEVEEVSTLVMLDPVGAMLWERPLKRFMFWMDLSGVKPPVQVDGQGNCYLTDGKALVSYGSDAAERWRLLLRTETDPGHAYLGRDGRLYITSIGEVIVVGNKPGK